jgi:hypothetical protein
MATILENSEELPPRIHRGLFVERYPDALTWLDENVWEIDIATEIHEPLANFRASLYYQAKALGMKLATKVVTRDEGRKVLLIRAY